MSDLRLAGVAEGELPVAIGMALDDDAAAPPLIVVGPIGMPAGAGGGMTPAGLCDAMLAALSCLALFISSSLDPAVRPGTAVVAGELVGPFAPDVAADDAAPVDAAVADVSAAPVPVDSVWADSVLD